MLWLLRCNAVASFDPFATGNYTENNNWLYHSGELDHRGHYPYDVFFIQPTLYILSIRETTGPRPNTLLHSRVIIPSQLIAKNTLLFDYYKDETRLIITLYLLDILIIIVYNKAGYFAY